MNIYFIKEFFKKTWSWVNLFLYAIFFILLLTSTFLVYLIKFLEEVFDKISEYFNKRQDIV